MPHERHILLLGANGQLGHTLAQTLTALGTVHALTREQADLSDALQLARQIEALMQGPDGFRPDAIVNAAAYTAVDRAESEPDAAMQVNATSVGVLAQMARDLDAVLVHYSSDYVFDGSGSKPWREDDAPAPLSVYGQSKWLGERAIAATAPRHLILRTSWVVGAHGGNFLKTMLRLAAERDELRVVADQHGAPTSARWLAQVTQSLLATLFDASADDPRWGLYHVAPSGTTTWHGYARHVIAGAWARGAALRCAPDAVHAIATRDYPLPAPRPHNSRLNTDQLQRRFGLDIPPWQDGVDAVLDELLGPVRP